MPFPSFDPIASARRIYVRGHAIDLQRKIAGISALDEYDAIRVLEYELDRLIGTYCEAMGNQAKYSMKVAHDALNFSITSRVIVDPIEVAANGKKGSK